MNDYVLDACFVVKFWIKEKNTTAVHRFWSDNEGARFFAPELMLAEVCNTLFKKVSGNEILREQALEAQDELLLMPVQFVGHTTLIDDALQLAHSMQHLAYDCIYLALARLQNAILVTTDYKLVSKVKAKSTALRKLLHPIGRP